MYLNLGDGEHICDGEYGGEEVDSHTISFTPSWLAVDKDFLGLVELLLPPNAANGLEGVIGCWEGGNSDSES